MSPFEYIRAAYRLRKELSLEIFTLIALGLILSYHAMTSPSRLDTAVTLLCTKLEHIMIKPVSEGEKF